jgi:hypothetical protein
MAKPRVAGSARVGDPSFSISGEKGLARDEQIVILKKNDGYSPCVF